MIKYFIFLQLFLASAFATDICEDGPVASFAKQLSLKNCVKASALALPKKERQVEICSECRKDFLIKYKSIEKEIKSESAQELYLNSALKEFEKNITDNLIESAKVRVLPSTGALLTNSINACKKKSLSEFEVGCKSPAALQLLSKNKLLDKIDQRVSNELAQILNDDPNLNLDQQSLLKRNKLSCFIPEKDVLLISTSAIEDTFSPELIRKLSQLDPSKFKATSELFLNEEVGELYDGDISELVTSLKSHPYLKFVTKTPNTLTSFLRSIPEPKDSSAFRKSLYSPEIGKQFDEDLAAHCETSFKALKEKICSPQFESGNISLGGIDNYSKIFGSPITVKEDELATNKQMIDENLNAFKLCNEKQPDSQTEHLLQTNSLISSKLSLPYKDMDLTYYQTQKWEHDFGLNMNKLCANEGKKCDDNSLKCKIMSNYSDLKDKNSRIFRLAKSSDSEANKLLRSIIGDNLQIDPQVRNVLVQNGILPKADGTIVSQPDIPERRPAQAIASSQNSQSQSRARTASSLSAPSSNNAYDDNSFPSAPEFASTSFSTESKFKDRSNTSDRMDSLDEQARKLKEVQDEIRRRLGPNNKPTSLASAKKMASEAFESMNQSYTPEQINSVAEQLMNPQAPSSFSGSSAAGQTGSSKAAVSQGKTVAQKFQEQQKFEALAGMAGAQQAFDAKSVAGSQEASQKELKKVALNIADDPKISLSEVFNKKLDPNDPETKALKELLTKQSNFLLQFKSMNFKVVFDKNTFNLLLESGDKKEAERIRPQLEMFLNKLKRNNTLHNLNQTWST